MVDRDELNPASPGTRGRPYAEGYGDRGGCALVGDLRPTGPEDLGDGHFPTRFDHDAVVVVRTVDHGLCVAWPLIGESEFRVIRPPTDRDRDGFAGSRLIAASAFVARQRRHAGQRQHENETACRIGRTSLHIRHSSMDVFHRGTLAGIPQMAPPLADNASTNGARRRIAAVNRRGRSGSVPDQANSTIRNSHPLINPGAEDAPRHLRWSQKTFK